MCSPNPNQRANGSATRASDRLRPTTARVKYTMPSGSMARKYSIVPQVRGSVNIALIRCSHGWVRSLYSGRRGMRSPSMTSTMRPSTSARMRVAPTNRMKNGMPMIRTARPSDSDAPVTTQAK